MENLERFDVVGLGVSTLDFLQIVDDLPGDETVQKAHESLLQGGGPVATAMVTLARLGSRTAMIDKVGDDCWGMLILDGFREENVATDWILTESCATSSISTILVRRRDGARSITYSPGNAGELTPNELPEKVIANARILHLNGRHFDASLMAARIARAHGVKVSFDGGAHRFSEGIGELVRLADICIVARDFAFSFSGTKDEVTAGRCMLDAGPEIVVITAGAEGSLILAKGIESFHRPAFPVDKPVDTTGAGDAYHGAFLHGLLKGLPLSGCAALASAVAAMNILMLGGRSALPSLEEADRFLARKVRSVLDGNSTAI
ncbi:MAG TPA: carbohydrate kinase family protein [Geobacteraceae bacterium]|nr:carbohydrate kinase family protein [Geobacteraceae bacterium]